MSSLGSSEPLDLERGLPVTPRDVAVQRELRRRAVRMSFAEYLGFLAAAAVSPSSPSAMRDRRGPRGEPFVLSF